MSLSDQWSPTSVQVTVLQARGLRIKGKHGTNDAYAVMQLGKEKYQTSVAEKSVAPVWKEEASFDMPAAHQGGTERGTLHVHVLHRALVGPDKLLGQAVINLLQLNEDKSRDKTQWFKLLDKSGKPDKDRGELLVDIQFTRNNMTASMFDISNAGKSRSRLGKFKDKVKGKKKEDNLSETSSNVMPPFSQVMTDSEGEGDSGGEGAAAGKEQKKKGKVKSLFLHKTNLQKSLSQSMSVLPGKNSSLSGSMSSGLNVEASEGKKKFKFLGHKRTASSDKKEQKLAADQSNLCINGSHVYCEEPAPRTSRASSNFSLASSGVGSMEDVPDSSPPSVGSRSSVRHSSPWTEEEEEETIEENTQVDEEMFRRQELEKLAMEERRMEEEQRMREEEERRQREEEEKRMDEEKRIEYEKMRIEQERLQKEEEQKQAAEMMRAEEERKKREEEERIEEQRKIEEEQLRREEEEKERVRKEEERNWLESEQRRREEEEEEKQRQAAEEEEMRREAERKAVEKRRREEREEEQRKLEEERATKERLVEEERKRQEEQERREEELRVEREREEERRIEEARKLEEEERQRLEEEEKISLERERERLREEEERSRKEQEEQRRLEEEERRQYELQQELERIRQEEEKMRLEKEKVEEEMKRKREEEEEKRVRVEQENERMKAEQRKLEELRRQMEEEELRRKMEEDELRRKMEEDELRRKMEEEELRRKMEEEELRRKMEEDELRRKMEEEEVRRKMEEEEVRRKIEEEERQKMEEEERQKREEALEKDKLAEEERRQEEEEAKRRREEEARVRAENAQRHSKTAPDTHDCTNVISTNPFDESDEDDPHEIYVPEGTGSVTSARQRCKLPVERNTCSSSDVRTTLEKRPAPKPPRMNSSGRPQAPRHDAQVNEQNKDKEIKTANVQPQRAVQKTHVSAISSHKSSNNQHEYFSHTARSSGRRPAPQRPSLTEEEHLPPKDPLLKSKQTPAVSNSNPFEDSEDMDELADTSAPVSVMQPPPVEQNGEKNEVSSIKIKSSKAAHAPAPPAITTDAPSIDTCNEMATSDINEKKDRAPVQQASPKESPQAVQEEALKDAPPVPSRRLQSVRPLNTQDQKPVSSIQEERDEKSNGEINCRGKENVKDAGPYALLTQEELISLVLKQESLLLEKSKKISELEQYIDNLLVRVIEEAPNVLMTITPLK